ncbi:MFS transporter [Chloroflexota bacterium]
MVSSPSKQLGFYGWRSLAGAMLIICSMVGNIVVAFGVFLPAMCRELDWTRSALSGPFTGFWIVMGFLGPLSGLSTGKFGPRKNMIAGNIMIVIGALLMSRVSEFWHVYLFFSVFIGAGQAFGTFLPANSIITNWFTTRRSLAISLLSAAGGVGGLIFPPLLSWYISTQGWRTAWIYLGITHLVMAVIVGGSMVRNRPEDMGQLAEGVYAKGDLGTDAGKPPPSRVYQSPVDWKVKDVLRTPAFWLIIGFASAMMFTLNFLTLHQVAYLQDLGYSSMVAAFAAGVFGGIAIVGQLTSGALGTRFESRKIAAVCMLGMIVGVTILMNVTALPLIYIHTVISGISAGGIMVVLPVLLGNYFGRANYPQILGSTTPVTTIFGAGSPLLAAYIYDSIGSYTPVFIVGLCLLGVGFVCALLAKPPIPRSAV